MDGFNLNDPNELYLVKANSINTNLSLDHHKVENREPLENAKLLADKNINKFFYPLVLKGSISKTIDDLQKNNFLYTRDLIDNMTNEQYLNHESFIFDQLNNIGFPSENLLNQHNEISGFLNEVSGNSNIFTREDIKNMSSNEYLKNEKAIFFQLNSIGIPSQIQANNAASLGALIWVDSYFRSDGTYVQGYFRSK